MKKKGIVCFLSVNKIFFCVTTALLCSGNGLFSLIRALTGHSVIFLLNEPFHLFNLFSSREAIASPLLVPSWFSLLK